MSNPQKNNFLLIGPVMICALLFWTSVKFHIIYISRVFEILLIAIFIVAISCWVVHCFKPKGKDLTAFFEGAGIKNAVGILPTYSISADKNTYTVTMPAGLGTKVLKENKVELEEYLRRKVNIIDEDLGVLAITILN